jgi:hypothetical protein
MLDRAELVLLTGTRSGKRSLGDSRVMDIPLTWVKIRQSTTTVLPHEYSGWTGNFILLVA